MDRSINQNPEVQIILPVHNEEEGIESVIMEIYSELFGRLPIEFIICEDGSQDRTREILYRLSQQVPMRLIIANTRKGYSQAIIDGFRAATSDYVLVLDADGQYSPKEFWKFYELRENFPIVIGWRKPRIDSFLRKMLSCGFKIIYKILFRIPIHDPSCPFIFIKKEVIQRLLNDLGCLKQGFWWEFTARAYNKGFKIAEIPIKHRKRNAGTTKVYHLNKLPGIAVSHIRGLFHIWLEVRK